jgi:Ca2+-binding EF-hand superfamily protein
MSPEEMREEYKQFGAYAKTKKVKKQAIAFISRKIPQSKAPKLKEIFESCDKDKNGYLDQAEL